MSLVEVDEGRVVFSGEPLDAFANPSDFAHLDFTTLEAPELVAIIERVSDPAHRPHGLPAHLPR
jgi:hypothetical protein